jgi:RimJ/RimL family protein N-acetyltransferase
MIKGDKINLRLVQQRDLAEVFRLDCDLSNRGDYFPLGLDSEASLNKSFNEYGLWGDDFGQMLIVAKDDRILGSIFRFKPVRYFDALEIAYILYDEASRGQGYMTEALSLMANYLFQVNKVNRLQLTVVVGNAASKRVAEKCGFKSEGILRGVIFLKGRNQDLEMFSLLREEAQGIQHTGPKPP